MSATTRPVVPPGPYYAPLVAAELVYDGAESIAKVSVPQVQIQEKNMEAAGGRLEKRISGAVVAETANAPSAELDPPDPGNKVVDGPRSIRGTVLPEHDDGPAAASTMIVTWGNFESKSVAKLKSRQRSPVIHHHVPDANFFIRVRQVHHETSIGISLSDAELLNAPPPDKTTARL